MPGNEDRVGYWLTPPDLMAELQAEFDFNFDSAPYPRPAGFDGLKEPWGTRTWCNPPFSKTGAWIRKANSEWRAGKMVVLCLAAHHLRTPIRILIDCGIDRPEIRLINVGWLDPEGNVSPWPNQAVLFILRPKP